MAVYQHDRVQYKPVREVRLDTAGALLSAGVPRYDSLAQYIDQFAAPLSTLQGSGLWSFQDPMAPSLRVLVECEPQDWCGRCDRSLDDCNCAF